MKSKYAKIPPKVISYRDYQKLVFFLKLMSLREIPIISYKSVNTISEVVLDKYAIIKPKYCEKMKRCV